MNKDGSVRVTFKEKERELMKFINDRSSPANYLKDLAREEMKKSISNNTNNTQNDVPTMNSNAFDFLD